MKDGIVACPVHGDNETTSYCPNCRPYQFDQKLNIVTCIYCSGSTDPHKCKHCGTEITEEYARKWKEWQKGLEL